MAEVKMDLQELKAIENKIEEVQKKADQDKKELQDKIDNLQKEKETLIKNQKRVMLTRTNYQIKYTIPATRVQTERALQTALNWTCKYHPMNMFDYGFNHDFVKNVLEYMDNNNGYGIEYYETKDVVNGKTEDKYEFINLDEAINTALKQEDSDYTKELKEIKKENMTLKKTLTDYDLNKEDEIKIITERENKRYTQLQKDSAKKYNEMVEDTSKKYKELEEESAKKYKALEEEFAKYKDDETKMNLQDKLEKYQKQNEELKKKLEEMDKKLKSKSLFGKIFG